MPTFLIALGAAVFAALVVWLLLRQRTALQAERLRAREEDNARLTAELAAARQQLAETTGLKASAETALAAERATAAEKIGALTDAHERLKIEFKALSADALSKNTEEFLKLARETFGKLHQQSAGELEKRQQAIDALVRPLRESLDKVGASVTEMDKARADAYGRLSEQIKSLGDAQAQLQTEATKLSTALRSTNYVGSWGQFQLRRVVEMADMLPYCDFSEQETVGALRPDLVIRLPSGRRIVVDAKAPIESSRAARETSDENVRAVHLADHAAKVRGHIDALGAKNYWEQFQPSPEFVVLFLPGDHFLADALQADDTLIDRALKRRVLLATPTTLIALLIATAYGWRQEESSRSAEEISALGRQLYDRIANFAEHLANIGTGLKNALSHYNKAVGSFEESFVPGARRFVELRAKGTKELAPPTEVDATARDVIKRA